MTVHPEPEVFVSYAKDDREEVLRLADRLERDGFALWIDRHQITGGMAWAQEIVRAIRRCKVVLLMCSDAAMRSRAVAQEVQLAWKYRLAYIPVLLHPTIYTAQLEFFLEGSQWIDAHDEATADWIVKVIESLNTFGIAPASGRSSPELAPPKATLSDLRKVAAFTTRIWPLVVEQVDRTPNRVSYVARDIGPPRPDARHEVRLGTRLFWAIDWDQDAYLLLLDEDAEGHTYCLCPSWFCPDGHIRAGITLLPPDSAHCEPFVITGQPGREHILAILSTQPLAEDWMPPTPATPARILSRADIDALTARIQRLDVTTWTALATYCDVTVDS